MNACTWFHQPNPAILFSFFLIGCTAMNQAFKHKPFFNFTSRLVEYRVSGKCCLIRILRKFFDNNKRNTATVYASTLTVLSENTDYL